MKRVAPRVAEWVDRCNQRTCHGYVDDGDLDAGELLGGDVIPETLWPILMHWHSEHVPVLRSTVRVYSEYMTAKAEPEELPRTIGMHSFQTGGATGNRADLTFGCYSGFWMKCQSVKNGQAHL